MSDRPRRPSEVLAEQVKVWRDQRKLSAQGLADRIKELGGSLSRVAISKIENGDRGVSLDEWLQLAHALAVPPPLLFIDLKTGADIAIAPNVALHPWLVWRWATGQEPPLLRGALGSGVVTRVEEYERARTAVHLYKHEQNASEAVHQALTALRSAEYTGDSAVIAGARSAHVKALGELATALDDMVAMDVQPPGKPRAWVEIMRELGLSKYPDRLVIWEPKGADGER
ncbi:helix-turn-helix domain-containing protein [Micromonospora mirobrigensis]|uniref:Helix-turn-helix domain-containing protein n=1 Tax=Micromonospora mirobrigensis TaxID=262898 RepID=A0A1C4YPQ0_9ACTN|nr:helix-turn-helix transcriptional regulator [Micromonospora mirobrigensis]SCF22762.1 Helix-turn-helix domain-containing protein [Micromonospora mirobrigensis]